MPDKYVDIFENDESRTISQTQSNCSSVWETCFWEKKDTFDCKKCFSLAKTKKLL